MEPTLSLLRCCDVLNKKSPTLIWLVWGCVMFLLETTRERIRSQGPAPELLRLPE